MSKPIFREKYGKAISVCRLLKFLPSIQSVKSIIRWLSSATVAFPGHVSILFYIAIIKRDQGQFKKKYQISQRGKRALMSYANSLGPGEHAHPCSLIWTFSVCRHILQYPWILSADNAGPDQPARMRRMIRACVVRKLYKGPFRALRIKYGLAHGKRDPMVFRFWGSSNTHEQSSVCFFFSFLFIYFIFLFFD